jgi:DNA-binding MarR family transcriptional regulator
MPKNEHPKAGTLYLIHVLTHATRTRLDGALSHLGLSAFQYTILDVIKRNTGLSSAKVSRRFHVSAQAMGELILSLERRGLVTREEDPKNRKILHLSLTREGKRLANLGDKLRGDLENHLFGAYSAEEMRHFRDIIGSALDLVRQEIA